MQLPLPRLVAHADWGSAPTKRWLALALLEPGGNYAVTAPQPVGDPASLLQRLRQAAGPSGPILVGFDFPIGLPSHYAFHLGNPNFLDLLPRLGQGEWSDFYQVASEPHQINLKRPFYPLRAGKARQVHLLQGLGMTQIGDLLRLCDRSHPSRRAACPLFWTMGGQQVGKAAILGWKEVLGPGLRQVLIDLAIWPFSGRLELLLRAGGIVSVETYPAEFYSHLGITFSPRRAGQKTGKRVQAERAANAGRLLDWASSARVHLAQVLENAIQDGFGPSPDAEDPFDTVIGLFGMLNIVLGLRPLYEPEAKSIRRVEGWIFGQAEYNRPVKMAKEEK